MIETVVETADYAKFTPEDYWHFTEGLNSFGILFHSRGDYMAADKVFSESLRIRGEQYGKTSEPYVCTLHNLAVLRKDQGKYEAAEDMFRYLLMYYEKVKGKTSREFTIVLNNKAMLDANLGRTKQAIQEMEEVMTLAPAVFLPDGIDAERVMVNRGLLAGEAGDKVAAIAFLQKASDQVVSKELDEHPDYYDIVIQLGQSSLAEGRSVEELPQLKRALQRTRSRYGEDNLVYSRTLEILAEASLRNKKYAEAAATFEQILSIRSKFLGNKHKDYLSVLGRLGICRWKSGNLKSAEACFAESLDNYLFLLERFFPTMSESEKSDFWHMLKPQADIFHSFAIENHKQKPELIERSYDLQLRTKGILLSSTSRIRNSILTSGDTELIQLYNNWIALKELLGASYSQTAENLDDNTFDTSELERAANELERKISKKSSLFSGAFDTLRVNWKAVKDRLQPGEAAVEVIRVDNRNSDEGVSYAALILKPGIERPTLIRIGQADDLEKRSFSFYRNAILNRVEDDKSFGTYWAPLESALGDARVIYFSPDGIYNRVNLNTLKRPGGGYLIDDKRIVILSNTRYARLQRSPTEGRGGAILIGDPLYGNDGSISPLPGTRAEIETLQKILETMPLPTQVFLSDQATEGVVKKNTGESILHIATHGFFLQDLVAGTGGMGVRISKARENPLLRSGLLFAGAGQVISGEPIIATRDNGILTAYEAMNLNLHGTKLVVLSACETGSGEVVSGEGVYGLSRAFRVAGAQSVLMSLWKVDDTATQRLMTVFYTEFAVAGDLLPSFMRAQKKIRAEFPEPYYWGAFVLIED